MEWAALRSKIIFIRGLLIGFLVHHVQEGFMLCMLSQSWDIWGSMAMRKLVRVGLSFEDRKKTKRNPSLTWAMPLLICIVNPSGIRIWQFILLELTKQILASKMVQVVKNPPANTGDAWDKGSIPRSGRSPGGGHGNPFSILAWRIAVDRGV